HPSPVSLKLRGVRVVNGGVHRLQRLALRDAEVLLTEFRDELRAQLRTASATGSVTTASVDALRAALEQARAAVRSTLG
ncbi:hypothetical protein C5D98_12080, partial [Rathayibacter rathayi]